MERSEENTLSFSIHYELQLDVEGKNTVADAPLELVDIEVAACGTSSDTVVLSFIKIPLLKVCNAFLKAHTNFGQS